MSKASAAKSGAGAAKAVGGAVLVVQLEGLQNPPAALELDVALAGKDATATVEGRRLQSIPGHYADYALALPLLPSSYVMENLRTGRTRSPQGVNPGVVLARLDIPFEVPAAPAVYLGRLVVGSPAAGSPAVRVEDHYEEDVVLVRSSVEPLRDAEIRSVPLKQEAAERARLVDRTPSAGGVDGAAAAAVEVDPSLAVTAADHSRAETLAPRAQAVFLRFLRLKEPRAFASDGSNANSVAQGKDAVRRAMAACEAESKQGGRCKLQAVDKTWLLPDAPCALAPSDEKAPDKSGQPSACASGAVKP